MAEFSISKKDLLGAMGYVTTTSGPVVPARSKKVETMKGTKPVGDQTSQKWDHRKYDNDSLLMNKNYLDLKDIGVKIMTEATTSTSYDPMRLNLTGMDMEDCSLNGKFMCDGQVVTFNIKYPNNNNKISVEVALESGDSNLYEVPLDSDQFKGNFAQSIRESARELINKVNNPADMDEMLYGVGKVQGVPSTSYNVADPFASQKLGLDTANADAMNFTAYESVDWKLHKLLDLCNVCALTEAEGEEFGPDDFAAPAGDMGGAGAPDPMANDGTQAPASAGEVNGNAGGNGDGDDTMEFREYMLPADPDHGSGLTQAAWDNMASIVADGVAKLNNSSSGGVKPSSSEWLEGFPGVKNMTPDEILEQFLSFDDYKALDTTLPIEGLKQFAHAMEEDKLDINRFKTNLGKWFPEVYNTDGTAMHDVAKETAAMTFPQDDNTGLGGIDPNGTMDFSGGFGDFGGGNGGSTGDMMDAANDFANGGGIDLSENGQDENAPDKTDLALDSLGNI